MKLTLTVLLLIMLSLSRTLLPYLHKVDCALVESGWDKPQPAWVHWGVRTRILLDSRLHGESCSILAQRFRPLAIGYARHGLSLNIHFSASVSR